MRLFLFVFITLAALLANYNSQASEDTTSSYACGGYALPTAASDAAILNDFTVSSIKSPKEFSHNHELLAEVVEEEERIHDHYDYGEDDSLLQITDATLNGMTSKLRLTSSERYFSSYSSTPRFIVFQVLTI